MWLYLWLCVCIGEWKQSKIRILQVMIIKLISLNIIYIKGTITFEVQIQILIQLVFLIVELSYMLMKTISQVSQLKFVLYPIT